MSGKCPKRWISGRPLFLYPEIFSKWVLINLSNPLRHPAPLVDPLLTKILDTAGPWCVAVVEIFFFLDLILLEM